MVIHCQKIGTAQPGQPWLVFLHGLLGSGEDWQALLPFLQDRPVLLVDLPGHGASRWVAADSFATVSQQLHDLLVQQSVTDYWLLGYSLGGRLAMYHACQRDDPGLRGLLVEGGHPGLADVAQREARQQHDAHWAARFRTEPLQQVLPDWYTQPVFADLNKMQREALTERRSHNHGPAVAGMLEATSLSHQPWLVDKLRQLRVPFGYLCGDSDNKFQALAAQYQLPLLSVANAGHNAHQANPADYAARIRWFISHPSKEQ
ncbi:2-succinyl-6-hydroxy-2,4-cyclohexadiene-1-carboxylate synthase [Brenneria uluponensis]|uniref:2-succinyl-6-hydroxy-2, 4-cyclohexadiene-1-carboxylate synthase n=1 Tax=Brenneria uluponensis TaxID=3057057 RepID=UPI0028E8F6FC|nr:2-succinyl-6-hydroxy-2,4-cyclohexadiene-1-carboxylate synthase [Brenneria ulupoensis]